VMTDAFERLADALNGLPNGFPRTQSNVEIEILRRIFSKEEASLACQLTGKPEPVDEIAERLGIAEAQIKTRLIQMAKHGLVWMSRNKARMTFRLAPFVVGIYESHLGKMDHEFAHLIEEYMESGGAEGIMKPQPAIHRVVPAQGAIKSEWILPYDDIKAMLEKAKSYRVRDCICRVQQDLLGKRKCDFPVKMCVTFSPVERPAHPNDVSKKEAIALLDRAEEIGLVHCVSNVIKNVFYICNCCGCCCGILRGVTDWGIEESVACANYYAKVDSELCDACGICVDRCQVKALEAKNGDVFVHREKCIGCGLCVTGCPSVAVSLERRQGAELVEPPDDFEAWEQMRLQVRNLLT
jgi:electron transport complex protein RnfB